MDYRTARKLHNDDQITIKETKEVVEIINYEWDEKNVWFEAMTNDGYRKLHHREVS